MDLLEKIYTTFLKHPFVCTDTRKITPGSIFFALKGESFNGNKFASQALAQGCSFAIIDEKEYSADDRCILVPDVLKSLQQLANHHRKQLRIPFIAITGSNGKTTTKELIHSVLSKKYNTCATKGNLNNHIGVPLTLLSVTSTHEMAVIEMGANHIGEIAELCEIAQPDFGIITNIGKAHLEGFGSPQGVIVAKSELYRFIKKNKGFLFVNGDNRLLIDISSGISKMTYGTSSQLDFIGQFLGCDPFVKLSFGLSKDSDTKTELVTHLIGNYNFENILAAACIGNYFKVSEAQIKEALENYIPSNNRSQMLKKGSNTILIDAYNANPTSMAAAIENFLQMDSKKKVLILGDMLELGKESKAEHSRVVEMIRSSNFSGQVILIGSLFSSLEKRIDANIFENIAMASEWVKSNPFQNSTILVKGSRGLMLEKLLEVM